VASALSCAQAVKPTYMSREWAADEQQSLWDPYGYVTQDRRERRRRLGVTMRQRAIKDLGGVRRLAIPSVRKDDQLIRCIGTGNETVRSCLGRLICIVCVCGGAVVHVRVVRTTLTVYLQAAIEALTKGADPDAICGSGTYTSLSALSMAVRLRKTRIIRELVLKGASLSDRGTLNLSVCRCVVCVVLAPAKRRV
jgi:hypothetical protein